MPAHGRGPAERRHDQSSGYGAMLDRDATVRVQGLPGPTDIEGGDDDEPGLAGGDQRLPVTEPAQWVHQRHRRHVGVPAIGLRLRGRRHPDDRGHAGNHGERPRGTRGVRRDAGTRRSRTLPLQRARRPDADADVGRDRRPRRGHLPSRLRLERRARDPRRRLQSDLLYGPGRRGARVDLGQLPLGHADESPRSVWGDLQGAPDPATEADPGGDREGVPGPGGRLPSVRSRRQRSSTSG